MLNRPRQSSPETPSPPRPLAGAWNRMSVQDPAFSESLLFSGTSNYDDTIVHIKFLRCFLKVPPRGFLFLRFSGDFLEGKELGP